MKTSIQTALCGSFRTGLKHITLIGAILGAYTRHAPAETNGTPAQTLPRPPSPLVWQTFTGLPASNYDYAVAVLGTDVFFASTEQGNPRLFKATAFDSSTLTELAIDANRLQSGWTWGRKLTGLKTGVFEGQAKVYLSSTTGIFRIDPSNQTDALGTKLYHFQYDTSIDMRISPDGMTLFWFVDSFGPESGLHSYNAANGLGFVHRTSCTWMANRITITATGELVGWYDYRGSYVARAGATPSLLINSNFYSTDGGETFTRLIDSAGATVQLGGPIAADSANPIIFADSVGVMRWGWKAGVFDPIPAPPFAVGNLQMDASEGVLFAGSGPNIAYLRFPEIRGQAHMIEKAGTNIGLVISGRPGWRFEIETAPSLAGPWQSEGFTTITADGLKDWRGTSSAQQKFYRGRAVGKAE